MNYKDKTPPITAKVYYMSNKPTVEESFYDWEKATKWLVSMGVVKSEIVKDKKTQIVYGFILEN